MVRNIYETNSRSVKTMAEKEYIEREEIIKRIKLRIDDYSRDCNSFAPKMVLAYKEFLYMVENLPTADVQEIVRCKDCKKFCPNLSFCTDNCIGEYGYCQITHMNVSLDFYCGYGEKKDKE
jgi:hypothetical protein